ncbi:MAG: glycosyltransferase family 4 protein [Bacteriovoracaceae bacterium]
MKTILYVSPNGYIGGAEKILISMVTQHHQIAPMQVKSLFFKSGEATESLVRQNIVPSILNNHFRLSRPGSLFRALKEIRHLVQEQKIEIIHSTMAYGHLVMSLATLGLPVKKVWFQHGPVEGLLDKLASLFGADLILFNSKYLKDKHLKHNFNLGSPKMKIIPLGVESLEQCPIKTISHKLRVLLVGRISPIKGFHLVLEALRELKKESESKLSNLEVLIIGKANTLPEKVYQNKLIELGNELEKTVTFLPFQAEMMKQYEKAHILIQPSLVGEGFGLVLAEAMGHGVLAVGPRYGGGGEILISGQTGINFDFNSERVVNDLKNFLENIASQYDEFQDIRENAFNLIQKQYSYKRMMSSLFSSYEEI